MKSRIVTQTIRQINWGRIWNKYKYSISATVITVPGRQPRKSRRIFEFRPSIFEKFPKIVPIRGNRIISVSIRGRPVYRNLSKITIYLKIKGYLSDHAENMAFLNIPKFLKIKYQNRIFSQNSQFLIGPKILIKL